MARIYVASLAAYNNATLHGAWIDLDDCTDTDDIQTAVSAMLADDPHHGEEWAIHDHDGFEGITIDEHESFDNVLMHSQMLARPAWGPYVDLVGAHYATAEGFSDAYRGQYGSGADYAQELAEDMGAVNDSDAWPHTCIDWEHAWRELSFDGYAFVNGYIFSGV